MLTPLEPRKEKILVATRLNYFDVDRIIATVVLGKLLSESFGVEIDLYVDRSIPVKAMNQCLNFEGVNIIEKLVPQYFTMSLDKGDAQISDVKWEVVGDRLTLKIFSDKGVIDTPELNQASGTPDYKHIYLLGIPTLSEGRKLFGDYASILDSSEVTNIDLRNGNESYAMHNYINAEASTFTEIVLNYLEDNQVALTRETATELLSALYWKTNSLRNRYAGEQSLMTARKLLQHGASLQKAVTNTFASMGLFEVKAIQEIYHNLQITRDKVAVSKVSEETAKQLSKVLPFYPNKNPLFTLKDIDASFVLVPIEEEKTLVLSTFHNRRLNPKKLFSGVHYVGDSLQGEITFEATAGEVEETIMKAMSKDTNKQEKVEKEEDNAARRARINKPAPQPSLEEYKEADPLPSTEEILTLEETPEPASQTNSPLEAFGGMMPQVSDPLPPAQGQT